MAVFSCPSFRGDDTHVQGASLKVSLPDFVRDFLPPGSPWLSGSLRMGWILSSRENDDIFPGGIEVRLALDELYENHRRGQYLSVILLGSMIIERQLVGLLHRQGSQAGWKMKSILDAAFSCGFIDRSARGKLIELHRLRNTYVHFFDQAHRFSLSSRALGTNYADILMKDAQNIIIWVEALIEKQGAMNILSPVEI